MQLNYFKCRNANTLDLDSLVLRLALIFVIVVRGDCSGGGRLSGSNYSVEPKQNASFVLPIQLRRYSPGCTDACVGKIFGVGIILGVVEGDYRQPFANLFLAYVFLHKFHHIRLVIFHTRYVQLFENM